MIILVRLIGIYIAVTGIIFLFSPTALKRYITFWGQGKKLYIVGVSRLLMGVILLLAASQCRLKVVVVTLGILSIIVSIPYFVLGIERMRALLSRWDKRPVLSIRILGFVSLVIGVLLIYAA